MQKCVKCQEISNYTQTFCCPEHIYCVQCINIEYNENSFDKFCLCCFSQIFYHPDCESEKSIDYLKKGTVSQYQEDKGINQLVIYLFDSSMISDQNLLPFLSSNFETPSIEKLDSLNYLVKRTLEYQFIHDEFVSEQQRLDLERIFKINTELLFDYVLPHILVDDNISIEFMFELLKTQESSMNTLNDRIYVSKPENRSVQNVNVYLVLENSKKINIYTSITFSQED